MVLYKESIAGPSRLELYRKEDDATAPPMVIELNTVTSVVAVEGKMEFMISFTDSQVTFACKANADVQDWVSDINRCRGVDFDTTHTSASNGSALYDAIPGDEVFAVRLRKSQSLTFQGACILEIEKIFDRSQFHISLFTEQSPRRLIVKWQIDHIRQYGSNETAFKFHSGSKSSTGVDWFVMDTEPGVAGRIHRAVDYWAKYIVEQIRNNQTLAFYTTIAFKSYIPNNFLIENITCFMDFEDCHTKDIQYHGSCKKVFLPDFKQAYATSIAVYSLSIIGTTVPSSVAMATSSFPSSSSGKFAISLYLDHPNRRTVLKQESKYLLT
eukprot:Em0018g114a